MIPAVSGMVSLDSDILRYIVEHELRPGDRLPTIPELSQELGVSVSKIREEMAVARALGVVQIRPRSGTQVQDFSFSPAVTPSVIYALQLNRACFQQFAKLRKSIELGFWHEAVCQLTPEDIAYLRDLVVRARQKLTCVPIEVPVAEHRSLHLTFFKHLENPFVQGLLEAYWTAYEAFGLALYADLSHHREVWDYHERMIECIARGDIDASYQAAKEHMMLLRYMPDQSGGSDQNLEEAVEQSSQNYHFLE
jgi:DNA-binding FadR family transcriptional regulator